MTSKAAFHLLGTFFLQLSICYEDFLPNLLAIFI